MKNAFYKILFYLAVVIATFGFFAEVKNGGMGFPHTDKIAHLVIFFGLTWLGCKAHSFKNVTVILSAAIYGAIIEICQGAFFARQASVADWVADLFGCLLALYFLKKFSGTTLVPSNDKHIE